MNIRRSNLIMAATAIAALAAAPAAAVEQPGSEAGASAVEIDGVATISGTTASTKDGGSASSTVIGLGDETVVGGSQTGTGSNSGEIATTGDTDQGKLTVGGWDAVVEEERSSASSSVVSGESADGDTRIDVLESKSEATSTGSSASTTGARISSGDNSISVLHAESRSDGEGGAYLVGLNGERIATSEDANGECQIDAEPAARILCLYAEATSGEGADGDPTGTGLATGVLDAEVADGNVTGGAFTTTSSSTAAGTESTPSGEGVPAGDPEGDSDVAGDAQAAGAPGDSLPRTGGGLVLSALGLAGMGGAVALRRLSR